MKRRDFLNNMSLWVGMGTLGVNELDRINSFNIINKSKLHKQVDENDLLSIDVTVPSTVGLHENFWIGIKLLTTPFFVKWAPSWYCTGPTLVSPFNESPRGTHYMDNVLSNYGGTVEIAGGDGFHGASTYSFKNGSGPYNNDKRPVRRLQGFSFSTPGIKFIRVRDPLTGIEGVSNPIHVDSGLPKQRLFWGGLHCHSLFGDAIRIPEEIYTFAKGQSFLDVFALTDHVFGLTPMQWNYFKEVTNTFYDPGRFVTFIGGEWTSRKYGHRNIIYPGEEGQIIRAIDSESQHPEQLYEIAQSHNALVNINHPASKGFGTDFSEGYYPEVERLVEVYQNGGSQEMPFDSKNTFSNRKLYGKEGNTDGTYIVDALAKGFRLGMIATGDTHDGRPGAALGHLQKTPGYSDLRGPGITGIWAKDLTRESIFDALWNRRVFGTTNSRTLLKFSINDHPMGAEISLNGKMDIKIEVASKFKIQRIDLVQNGEIILSQKPQQLETSWSPQIAAPSKDAYYYVRVLLDDENMAWSSPIWINVG